MSIEPWTAPTIQMRPRRRRQSRVCGLKSISIPRRRFLKQATLAAGAGAALIAADAGLIEPNVPHLIPIDLRIAGLPAELEGMRIAQLSDFHYDEHFTVHPIRAAIEKLNEIKPEVTVLTGDFVTSPAFAENRQQARPGAAAAEPCARVLSALAPRLRTFAVLGNHDVYTDPEEVSRALTSAGIRVLRNNAEPVVFNNRRLWFVGSDDAMEGSPDLPRALRGIPGDEPVVLLLHEPDYADEVRRYPIVNVQLSGHSHGGQVRIPLVGPPYLPDMGKKYPWGLRQLGSLILYTNVGIGTIRVPVRWNCPPEITLFTLRSK